MPFVIAFIVAVAAFMGWRLMQPACPGGVVVAERAWLQAGTCAGYRVKVPADAIILPGSRLIAD